MCEGGHAEAGVGRTRPRQRGRCWDAAGTLYPAKPRRLLQAFSQVKHKPWICSSGERRGFQVGPLHGPPSPHVWSHLCLI